MNARGSRALKVLVTGGLAVGFTPALGAAPAWACSCAPASDTQYTKFADVVFKGKLIERMGKVDGPNNTGAETVTYKFRPTRTIKGKVSIPQLVTTSGSSASCGIRLTKGATYLVYANRAEPVDATAAARRKANKEPLSIGLCGGTSRVKKANAPTGDEARVD